MSPSSPRRTLTTFWRGRRGSWRCRTVHQFQRTVQDMWIQTDMRTDMRTDVEAEMDGFNKCRGQLSHGMMHMVHMVYVSTQGGTQTSLSLSLSPSNQTGT
jgi:hypothetical protein